MLVVDEAGQMSLAHTVAASQAAPRVVLLGDPQQLDQPQKGSHPDGVGVSALAHLLGRHGVCADAPRPELNGGLHHRAKVRRVIQLFMNGGASQMDTFDYKPMLEKKHGQKVDFGIKVAVTSPIGTVMKSPFAAFP